MDQTFEQLRAQITAALPNKLQTISHTEAGFTLVEGFVSLPIQQNLSAYNIGGPSVPMVAVVGNSSGKMYFFALKALLLNLDKK